MQSGNSAKHRSQSRYSRLSGQGSTLLQLYNVASLGAFWPFFTGILLQIVAAMLQFARMILLPPE